MFEIPEDDAALLRTGAGLTPFDEHGNPTPLPEKLQETYMRFKRVRDRIDMSPMTPDALCFILVASGYGAEAPKPADSVATLYRKGVLKYGDPVLVNWQNKDREAKIIGNVGDDAEVVVDLNGTERRVATNRVKLSVATTPQVA